MLSFVQFVTEEEKPFASAEELRNHFQTKHPGVDVQFHDSKHYPHSSLSMIKVPKEHQKQGIGGHIMKAITQYADHHGRSVSLSPEKRPGGPSKSKLTDWYKSHGFKKNRDSRFSDSMLREPKAR
jgi:GNAT superfamily N-acetyltransferase